MTLEKSAYDKLDIVLFYVLFRAVVHGTGTEDRCSKAGYCFQRGLEKDSFFARRKCEEPSVCTWLGSI